MAYFNFRLFQKTPTKQKFYQRLVSEHRSILLGLGVPNPDTKEGEVCGCIFLLEHLNAATKTYVPNTVGTLLSPEAPWMVSRRTPILNASL